MEEHIQYLETVCRLCGKNLTRSKASVAKKETLKVELWKKFQINVDLDRREIHPPSICSGCKRFLYRVREVSDPEKVATKRSHLCGQATASTVALVWQAKLKEKGAPVRLPNSQWNGIQRKLVGAKPRVARIVSQSRKRNLVRSSVP